QELREMPYAGFIVDDQPVRPVPHVARPDLAEEPAPYLGMDAVGADQEIRLEDLAAPGFRAHAIWPDVDAPNADVEPYCRGGQAGGAEVAHEGQPADAAADDQRRDHGSTEKNTRSRFRSTSCTFMPVIHTMRYIDLTYAGAPS